MIVNHIDHLLVLLHTGYRLVGLVGTLVVSLSGGMTSSYIPGLTQQSLASELAFQLNNTQTQLNNLTSQLSAGVNVTKPSDNPTALVQILGVQSQLTRYTQYQA